MRINWWHLFIKKFKWFCFLSTIYTLSPNLINRCREFSLSDDDCSNSMYLPLNEYLNYLKKIGPVIKDDYCNGERCMAVIYKDESKCSKCTDKNCLSGCKKMIHTDRNNNNNNGNYNGNNEQQPIINLIKIDKPPSPPSQSPLNNIITITQEITKTIERSTTPLKIMTSTLLSSVFSTSTKTITKTNVSTVKISKTKKPTTETKTVTIEPEKDKENKEDKEEKECDDKNKKDKLVYDQKEKNYDGDKKEKPKYDDSVKKGINDKNKLEEPFIKSTKKNIITLTREIPTTITLDRPITLFREVTTTITSEVPIINYKVTTFTKSLISTIEKVSTTTEKLSITKSVPTTITSVMTSIVTTMVKPKEEESDYKREKRRKGKGKEDGKDGKGKDKKSKEDSKEDYDGDYDRDEDSECEDHKDKHKGCEHKKIKKHECDKESKCENESKPDKDSDKCDKESKSDTKCDKSIPSTVSISTITKYIEKESKSIEPPTKIQIKTVTSTITNIQSTTTKVPETKLEYKTLTSTITIPPKIEKESDVDKLIPLLKEFLTIENKPKKKKKVNPQTAKRKIVTKTFYTKKKKCLNKKVNCLDCDSTCED